MPDETANAQPQKTAVPPTRNDDAPVDGPSSTDIVQHGDEEGEEQWTGPKGISFFSEKYYTAGPFTMKAQYDKDGNLVSTEAEQVTDGIEVPLSIGIAELRVGVQLLNIQTSEPKGTGRIRKVTMKVSLKGFGSLMVGVGAKVAYELSLEGYTKARTINLNFRIRHAPRRTCPIQRRFSSRLPGTQRS